MIRLGEGYYPSPSQYNLVLILWLYETFVSFGFNSLIYDIPPQPARFSIEFIVLISLALRSISSVFRLALARQAGQVELFRSLTNSGRVRRNRFPHHWHSTTMVSLVGIIL